MAEFPFFSWLTSTPLGEGNGNPLQCSCLENPRDGGVWWAAVYGVAQSRTRLKRLGSSSILYWFCHTSTWIRHGCTRVPNPESPSHLLPHTIPLGHSSAPAPSFLYPASNLDWRFISYMILYMFQCHSLKSSPTPPTESKRLFYTSLSLLLSRIQVIVTIFLNSIYIR